MKRKARTANGHEVGPRAAETEDREQQATSAAGPIRATSQTSRANPGSRRFDSGPPGFDGRAVRRATPCSVRRATVADLPAILALRMALLREHSHNAIYGRLRVDAEARAARLFALQLRSDNEVVFLAELDGRSVGVLRCIASTGSPLLEPAHYCYVSSVYVLPAARERGVLRALLAAAEAWCVERGLEEMRLHNAADNPLANAAWDALGFEVVELLRIRRLDSR